MPLLVVYNPVCGDSTAEQFFSTHVIPRLYDANKVPTEIICTRGPGHAGVETLSFLDRHKGDTTVVLGSGDGTLHEIVNHLAFARTHEDIQSLRAIHFVLVPCGTANALYASLFRPSPSQEMVVHKLRSLEAFLGTSTPGPLTLSLISFVGPRHIQGNPQPVVSTVVTSTALHAVILRDSEKLRKEIPSIERFKVAAQQNIAGWYASHVRLLPMASSGAILTYDPERDDFVPSGNSNEDGSTLDVDGPFAYFLSTVNVDRLEPEFRINPMISKSPSMEASMDVVMVRPQRDPSFTLDTLQARWKFAEKIVAVLATAYQDGIHLSMRYSADGDVTRSGDGNTIVECFRCGGWEWIPEETDENAHLLCADGTIFEIEKGGQAACKAASGMETILRNFYVHI